jgi:hypothetical protein
MSAVVRLKGFVKVPLFCVNQRLCKHCFKKEWTLVDDAIGDHPFKASANLRKFLTPTPLLSATVGIPAICPLPLKNMTSAFCQFAPPPLIFMYLLMNESLNFKGGLISKSIKKCSLFFRVLQTYVVNFICQKVQHFQADSEYLGKINTKKKKFKFFFNV